MLKKSFTNCSICASHRLEELISLPKFPFTGIYVDDPDVPKFTGVDQGFLLCENCGHGQLKYVIDPDLVYDDTYTHRSSSSSIATSGNDYFADFLRKITKGRKFNRVVDVGCNDLYLLGKIRDLADAHVGIDPIWRDQEYKVQNSDFSVLGKFIEEVDFTYDLGGRPDLVISAHAFEHVENPRLQIQRLVDAAADDALFVIEVPGFDSLLANYRFDQIFHQHIHYYSLSSFSRLIQELACEYVAHDFNYGYWGGTMLFAFKKAAGQKFIGDFAKPNKEIFSKSFSCFQNQLMQCLEVVQGIHHEPIYGYGAAQMLPTIAYHMKSDLSFLTAVLDDNSDRAGLTYPYLPVKISKPSDDMTLQHASVLITALDSTRPILRRVMSMKARRILTPLNIF